MRALDVGCGSGYLAAVMARMVGVEGKVVAMDYLSPLVALSLENLRKTDADLIDSTLANESATTYCVRSMIGRLKSKVCAYLMCTLPGDMFEFSWDPI